MNHTGEQDVTETRSRSRYVFTTPVSATLNGVAVRILNISSTGLQMENADPFKLHTPYRLVVTLPRSIDAINLRAAAVWSRLSRTPNKEGKYLYRSGLRFEGLGPAVSATVERIITIYSGEEDARSLERKREALRARSEAKGKPIMRPLPMSSRQIDEDQRMVVEQTLDRLAGDRDQIEALSQRARLSLFQRSEGHTLSNEVLAVWEYLDRTIPVDIVNRIVSQRRR